MIAFEEMDKMMDTEFQIVDKVDFHGLNLEVRRLIPYELECGIVQRVSDACFNPETGEWMPEVEDFAKKLSVIAASTNLEIPADAEDQYRLVYQSDLWSVMESHLDEEQMLDITLSIERRVSERLITNRKKFEAQFEEAAKQIGEIGRTIGEMFSGITPDEMSGIIRALGDGTLDEEKLVREVVKMQNELRAGEQDNVIPFPKQEDDGE